MSEALHVGVVGLMGQRWRRFKNRLHFCAECGKWTRWHERIVDEEGTVFCDDGCYNP